MASSLFTAIAAGTFLSTLGVNTHIDFKRYGYEDLDTVAVSLRYLGVQNVRDSAQSQYDLQAWPSVAHGANVKFNDYMPEGSPQDMQNALALVPALADTGVLNAIEGGNEEDDAYAISRGNSLAYTASFQQQVYAMGKRYNLPVINMSFGAGWTWTNNWQGDYGTVGDLSAYADWGNAHSYPLITQGVDSTMKRIAGLAKLAAASRPVATTEIGWNESQGFTQDQVARYVLCAAFDGWKDEQVKTYYYALYDDGSGKFGLMLRDGTPKPAGTALHNLTTLLADADTSFTPGSLSYGFTDTLGGENNLTLQKSDGSYWVAVWDEVDQPHPVTLTLATAAAELRIFDPMRASTPVQTAANSAAVTLNLANYPVLVQVIPTPPQPPQTPSVTQPTPTVPSTPSPTTTTQEPQSTTPSNAGATPAPVTFPNLTLVQFFGSNTMVDATANPPLVYLGGTGNTLLLGGAATTLIEIGQGNDIRFGKPGSGEVKIYGRVLDNADTLDLSTVMSATEWNGTPATVGNFLKVNATMMGTAIQVVPSGQANGIAYTVATLLSYYNTTFADIISHTALTRR